MKKKLALIIGIIIALCVYSFGDKIAPNSFSLLNEEIIPKKLVGEMRVHFIDVGQGDATFIELPNDEVMLIDSGESSEEEIVASYIKRLGYEKIDYVVGTHPHTDHIGGLAYIINNFAIGKVYMPKAVSTTKTYENLLQTIKDKGLKVKEAKAGIQVIGYENFNMYFVAPNSSEYEEINNYSACLKIEYLDNKFLFMGDAEVLSEKEIKADVGADVIKVGHHGSNTSSSEEFVKKVNAQYAIISVGKDNQYKLPKPEIVERWENSGAEVYRTDIEGNIIVVSDGKNIKVENEINN